MGIQKFKSVFFFCYQGILTLMVRGGTLHYGRTSVTLLKYDKIGLKIVALGLNLSPFCRRYENVINLTLPITLVIG